MKKQYLVGILGLAALSAPIGASMLSATQIPSTTADEQQTTGTITIDSSSEVTVFDTSEKPGTGQHDGVVSAGDQLESITLNATYNSSPEGDSYVVPTDDAKSYHVTDGTNTLNVSYEDLIGFGMEDENNDSTYTLVLNYNDGTTPNDEKPWKYTITDIDSFNISMTSTLVGGDSDSEEVELGTVEIKDEVSNYEVKAPYVEAGDVIVDENYGASVEYNIHEVSDVKGDVTESLTVTKVEWISLSPGEDQEEYLLAKKTSPIPTNSLDVKGELVMTVEDNPDTKIDESVLVEDANYTTIIRVTAKGSNGELVDIADEPVDFQAYYDDGKMTAGAIVGIIIGVVLVIGLIAFVGNMLYKKYNDKNTTSKKVEEKE